jgi:hypothetical protein
MCIVQEEAAAALAVRFYQKQGPVETIYADQFAFPD